MLKDEAKNSSGLNGQPPKSNFRVIRDNRDGTFDLLYFLKKKGERKDPKVSEMVERGVSEAGSDADRASGQLSVGRLSVVKGGDGKTAAAVAPGGNPGDVVPRKVLVEAGSVETEIAVEEIATNTMIATPTSYIYPEYSLKTLQNQVYSARKQHPFIAYVLEKQSNYSIEELFVGFIGACIKSKQSGFMIGSLPGCPEDDFVCCAFVDKQLIIIHPLGLEAVYSPEFYACMSRVMKRHKVRSLLFSSTNISQFFGFKQLTAAGTRPVLLEILRYFLRVGVTDEFARLLLIAAPVKKTETRVVSSPSFDLSAFLRSVLANLVGGDDWRERFQCLLKTHLYWLEDQQYFAGLNDDEIARLKLEMSDPSAPRLIELCCAEEAAERERAEREAAAMAEIKTEPVPEIEEVLEPEAEEELEQEIEDEVGPGVKKEPNLEMEAASEAKKQLPASCKREPTAAEVAKGLAKERALREAIERSLLTTSIPVPVPVAASVVSKSPSKIFPFTTTSKSVPAVEPAKIETETCRRLTAAELAEFEDWNDDDPAYQVEPVEEIDESGFVLAAGFEEPSVLTVPVPKLSSVFHSGPLAKMLKDAKTAGVNGQGFPDAGFLLDPSAPDQSRSHPKQAENHIWSCMQLGLYLASLLPLKAYQRPAYITLIVSALIDAMQELSSTRTLGKVLIGIVDNWALLLKFSGNGLTAGDPNFNAGHMQRAFENMQVVIAHTLLELYQRDVRQENQASKGDWYKFWLAFQQADIDLEQHKRLGERLVGQLSSLTCTHDSEVSFSVLSKVFCGEPEVENIVRVLLSLSQIPDCSQAAVATIPVLKSSVICFVRDLIFGYAFTRDINYSSNTPLLSRLDVIRLVKLAFGVAYNDAELKAIFKLLLWQMPEALDGTGLKPRSKEPGKEPGKALDGTLRPRKKPPKLTWKYLNKRQRVPFVGGKASSQKEMHSAATGDETKQRRSQRMERLVKGFEDCFFCEELNGTSDYNDDEKGLLRPRLAFTFLQFLDLYYNDVSRYDVLICLDQFGFGKKTIQELFSPSHGAGLIDQAAKGLMEDPTKLINTMVGRLIDPSQDVAATISDMLEVEKIRDLSSTGARRPETKVPARKKLQMDGVGVQAAQSDDAAASAAVGGGASGSEEGSPFGSSRAGDTAASAAKGGGTSGSEEENPLEEESAKSPAQVPEPLPAAQASVLNPGAVLAGAFAPLPNVQPVQNLLGRFAAAVDEEDKSLSPGSTG